MKNTRLLWEKYDGVIAAALGKGTQGRRLTRGPQHFSSCLGTVVSFPFPFPSSFSLSPLALIFLQKCLSLLELM